MAGVNLPLMFGALLAGAVVIDYGVKNAKAAFNGPPAASAGSSPVTGPPGSYTSPIDPGAAHVGRTDQGVDVSAPAGTPIRALGKSRVIGILPNWYSGQPFVWLQLLDGPDAGKYWYVAEQITPSVSAGDLVQAGQQIGTVAASGTGLELGWATSTGETLARSTTGYVEGEVTTAGDDFRKLLVSVGL